MIWGAIVIIGSKMMAMKTKLETVIIPKSHLIILGYLSPIQLVTNFSNNSIHILNPMLILRLLSFLSTCIICLIHIIHILIEMKNVKNANKREGKAKRRAQEDIFQKRAKIENSLNLKRKVNKKRTNNSFSLRPTKIVQ